MATPQRVMEADRDREPANPPQYPNSDDAAVDGNRRRRPISNSSRIGKRLKGESWIMGLDNPLIKSYLHMLLYHICKF